MDRSLVADPSARDVAVPARPPTSAVPADRSELDDKPWLTADEAHVPPSLVYPTTLLPVALEAFARLLEAETGETVLVPPHPQLIGAYGAVLLALAMIGEPAGRT
jgi:hypothetical protein